MKKICKVQALEDVKFEQSPKGKGFKEAQRVIVICDSASKDEFVAVLHGNDAVREFPVGELVAVTMKARAKRQILKGYTQLLDVTHIEVVKREIKHCSTIEELFPWDF